MKNLGNNKKGPELGCAASAYPYKLLLYPFSSKPEGVIIFFKVIFLCMTKFIEYYINIYNTKQI